MSMNCPACSGDLQPVDTEGHYGTRLVVDSCAQCRGFWLERIEPVSIGHQAVTDLEGDADLGAISTQRRSDFRKCPKCQTGLAEFTGAGMPEGLHVDTCTTCDGMWFDRGELLVYKSGLEQKRKARNEQAFKERSAKRPGQWHNSRYRGAGLRAAANALTLIL